jgi:hypothetical protein
MKKGIDKSKKESIDRIIDQALERIPYAKFLTLNPEDHKTAGIGKFQYRKLKVQISELCPPGKIYISPTKINL